MQINSRFLACTYLQNIGLDDIVYTLHRQIMFRYLQNRMHLQKIVPLKLWRIFTLGPSHMNKVIVTAYLEQQRSKMIMHPSKTRSDWSKMIMHPSITRSDMSKMIMHPSKTRSAKSSSRMESKHLQCVMESTPVPNIKN